jgi:hypothetical protein
MYLSKDVLMFARSVQSNLCSYYQAHTKTKEKLFAENSEIHGKYTKTTRT